MNDYFDRTEEQHIQRNVFKVMVMIEDISESLEEWEFEPGVITVRKIIGDDGSPKVQMRLELGVIQMEMTGRPDGLHPHDKASYLQYYKEKLAKFFKKNGTVNGFRLTAKDCSKLRSESLQYYYRYLSLFHLNELEQVVVDTARNLEVAELLKRFADSEEDRYSIEQYLAYILMMNAQANARLAWKKGEYSEALGVIRQGIRGIKKFLTENLREVETDSTDCHEIRLLEKLEKSIIEDLPEESLEKLNHELQDAISKEEFEKAASLRDRIRDKEVVENS